MVKPRSRKGIRRFTPEEARLILLQDSSNDSISSRSSSSSTSASSRLLFPTDNSSFPSSDDIPGPHRPSAYKLVRDDTLPPSSLFQDNQLTELKPVPVIRETLHTQESVHDQNLAEILLTLSDTSQSRTSNSQHSDTNTPSQTSSSSRYETFDEKENSDLANESFDLDPACALSTYDTYIPINRSPNYSSSDSQEDVPEDIDAITEKIFPRDNYEDDDDKQEDILLQVNENYVSSRPNVVNSLKADFLIAALPFDVLMGMIKKYLKSVDRNPKEPDWPVPNMDRNQKRNFRRTCSKYKLDNKGKLLHLHMYKDRRNSTRRSKQS